MKTNDFREQWTNKITMLFFFSIEEGQTCTEKNRGGKSLTTMKLECKTEKEGWVQKLKQKHKVGVWGNERMERKTNIQISPAIKSDNIPTDKNEYANRLSPVHSFVLTIKYLTFFKAQMYF